MKTGLFSSLTEKKDIPSLTRELGADERALYIVLEALVKDNKSDKSDIVLEEMSSNQGSLFSFLNLGKFIQEF